VGCGGGCDSRALIRLGWEVDALDSNAAALKIAELSCNSNPKLKPLQANFEEVSFLPNAYDLINAGFSLPFCHPSSFANFWRNLASALKPGGFLSCDFLGVNDEWNIPKRTDMTFLSRENINLLVKDFEILQLDEKEEEAPTVQSPTKHWHIFTCNLQKKTISS
jgi:tellurite methyltransferase